MQRFEKNIQKELDLIKAHAENKDRPQLDHECATIELDLISEDLK